MKELALHILDVTENSIKAHATEIQIIIKEDIIKDLLTIEIKDNGDGMDEDTLAKVTDPFFTTRTTRKVGLGLSLFKTTALQCNGAFKINSKKGKGTTVVASFQHSHIDRAPMGNMEETIVTLITANKDIEYSYTHFSNNNKFEFNTMEIKKILRNVEITETTVLFWLKEYIKEGLQGVVKK
ncbi:MAG: ATP-binding protein [Clostridiaceae bacterium]|nr:ATP-binding protein [Clostridiaceae bacterium]